MVVYPQNINVKITNRTITHFLKKGYNCKSGDIINVDVSDLPIRSTVKILFKCDCPSCNSKEYYNTLYNINRNKDVDFLTKKTFCYSNSECKAHAVKQTLLDKYNVENAMEIPGVKQKIENHFLDKYGTKSAVESKEVRDKTKHTLLEKYGVEYSWQIPEVKQKSKETLMNRYNVDNPFKSEEIKEKIKQTNLRKYGVEYVSQSVEIKEKIKQTNLKRYNVKCILSSKEIREKIKQTNLKKYGVENPWQSEIIKMKIRESLFNNGTAPCSKQQKYLHKLLGGELNYPIDDCSLDIAFPEQMIYIEYDGSGHNTRYSNNENYDYNKNLQKDINREYFLKNKGWKIIRIISKNDKLPSDDIMLKLIDNAKNYLLKSNHTWVKINIDNSTYECSQENININLGKLKFIKKDDK